MVSKTCCLKLLLLREMKTLVLEVSGIAMAEKEQSALKAPAEGTHSRVQVPMRAL